MNQKEGRSQREAAREAYLMSLGKARLHEEQDVRLIAKICDGWLLKLVMYQRLTMFD